MSEDITSTPHSKAELLQRIHGEYDKLEQALSPLSDEQMLAAPAAGWSVKDLLAHITAWQQILLRFHIGRQPFAEAAPGIAVDYATSDVDTINDALYRRDRDKPLPEVLEAFRRSHRQTLAAVEGMSEAELFGQYTPPGRDPSDGGQLINWVAGDTYEHYMEHRATIEALATQ